MARIIFKSVMNAVQVERRKQLKHFKKELPEIKIGFPAKEVLKSHPWKEQGKTKITIKPNKKPLSY